MDLPLARIPEVVAVSCVRIFIYYERWTREEGKRRDTDSDGGAEAVELALDRRVLAVYRVELALEICERQPTKTNQPSALSLLANRSARTFLRRLRVIRPLAEAPDVLSEPDARRQFRSEDIALVEEDHEIDCFEERVGAQVLPQQDRVLQSVHALVLSERLVEPGYRREEDDGYPLKIRSAFYLWLAQTGHRPFTAKMVSAKNNEIVMAGRTVIKEGHPCCCNSPVRKDAVLWKLHTYVVGPANRPHQ